MSWLLLDDRFTEHPSHAGSRFRLLASGEPGPRSRAAGKPQAGPDEDAR